MSSLAHIYIYLQPVQYDQGKASAAAQGKNLIKGRAEQATIHSSRATELGDPEGGGAWWPRQKGSADGMEATVAAGAG